MMTLPLEGITAVVLGTGPDLPAGRLDAFRPYFTIGINRLWQHTTFRPDVSFWIDGGIYEECPDWFDTTLCVCDQSARPRGRQPPRLVALPARGGPMPDKQADLDPRQLWIRPNTGVVAALWAASLGCWPVVLLGMGCESDGRRPEQARAMRAALDEILDRDYRRAGDWRNVFWPWTRAAAENACVWASYTLSPRLRACDGDEVRRRLQAFYARDERCGRRGSRQPTAGARDSR